MKTALLIIDMQKMFFERGGVYEETYKSATQFINQAIYMFDQRNLPVYAVYHTDESYGLTPDADGYQFYEEINITDRHTKIEKRYGNSFNKTGLTEELKEKGVTNVIVTGYCAEYCVLSTVRGALDMDFKAAVLRGALASGVKKHIRFVEDINEVISLKMLELLLDK